jgi:nucleotide-binding universal stress UspA family protein
MRTIVVPTDFSSIASNAAHYGAELAININASLTLLHICELPVAYSEVPMSLPGPTELVEEAEIKMEELKNEVIKHSVWPIKINIEIKVGSIEKQLTDFCARVRPYAVVMGNLGQGEIESLLFGSNTVWAMRHLPCPVIVVPANTKFKTIRSVGLACDFKKVVATTPVKEIRTIVKDFHANLHVLYINTDEDKDQYDAVVIEGSGQLQEMLHDLHPHYHFIDYPDIDEGISEFSKKYYLDLLIVVPRKHDLLSRLFH